VGKPKPLDFLIVGQGLAGTLLAHFLLRENQNMKIIDCPHQGAASKVAAGIINPITGRRFVKSWRVDELIPFAEKTYREIESKFGIKFFHQTNILRSLFSVKEESDWLARTAQTAWQQYTSEKAELGEYETKTRAAFSYAELTNSAQVEVSFLVETYRKYLLKKEYLIAEPFDFQELEVKQEVVLYKNIKARKLVFCEGFKLKDNPFFNYLPLTPTKGEILLVHIPGAKFEKILKHKLYIVPLKNELFWVGSAYQREFETNTPSEKGLTWLENCLHDILTVPFEVVSHLAAIRPTVKDRRPFLGQHPQFPALTIFNGLGTKGASLGPFFAKQITNYLLGKGGLDKEADIKRFLPKTGQIR